MVGFRMDVVSLSEGSIRLAQYRLRLAYRFGSLYLRSSRIIQGRGLRIFNETGNSDVPVVGLVAISVTSV